MVRAFSISLLVSFTSGFDMDKYAGSFSSVDFVVGDIGFFNTMVTGDNEASAQIIDGIKERCADSVGGCGYEATGYVMEEEPYERWRASYSGFSSEEEIEMMRESDMTDEGYFRDSVLVEGLDPNLFLKLELVEGDIAPLLDAETGEPLVFEDDVLYKGSEDVQAEQRLNNSREVYYTVGAGAVSTVLSVAAMPLIGTLLENMFWFYSRSFRIWPIAVMLPIFALLGIMVPGILYNRFEKQSVVENLQVLC